jgi:hypothetical protein
MSIIFTTLHRHPVRNDHYNVEKLIHQLTQLPQPITIEMVATKMSQFSFQHYSYHQIDLQFDNPRLNY